MSETAGKDITKAFQFMRNTFEDTSRLLEIFEHEITNSGFVSTISDSTCMWRSSSSYRGWDRWMPYFVGRGYKKLHEEENNTNKLLRAFIFIHYLPKNGDQPILSFGVVKTRNKPDSGIASWGEDIWPEEGPTFFTGKNTLDEWHVTGDTLQENVQQIYYQVRNLINIRDKKTVLDMCDELIGKFNEIE